VIIDIGYSILEKLRSKYRISIIEYLFTTLVSGENFVAKNLLPVSEDAKVGDFLV